MTPEVACEICVLGGGPAGAVAARRLAQLGHDTVLVRRAWPPDAARTESLAPSTLSILDSLDLRGAIDPAIFLNERRALVRWGSDAPQDRHFGARSSGLVERSSFDARLREAASAAGARVIDAARVGSPKCVPAGGWSTSIRMPNGPASIRSTFLVDARGKQRRTMRWPRCPGTVALSAVWAGRIRLSRETRIEALNEGWVWGSPSPDKRYTATLFVDLSSIAGRDRMSRIRMYRKALSGSTLLREILSGAMTRPLSVRDATPGMAGELIGADFIRVGEAAFSIDPLSSQGIQCAIVSATQAAAAVHTILSPSQDRKAAVEFYEARQRDTATEALRHATHFYREGLQRFDDPFWSCRASQTELSSSTAPPAPRDRITLPSSLALSPAVRMVDVPVLSGDYVVRMRAVNHPALLNPIAFCRDIPIAMLLDLVGAEVDTCSIPQRWARYVPPVAAFEMAKWMFGVGILCPPKPRTILT
jgi:flavin-dependent dehydrogenase